jgi:hypothetical protein
VLESSAVRVTPHYMKAYSLQRGLKAEHTHTLTHMNKSTHTKLLNQTQAKPTEIVLKTHRQTR